MTVSLEERFQRFLDHLDGSERILDGRSNVRDGEKQADYILCSGKLVAEIKTLKAPQRHKGESVIDEYLSDARVEVFGTLPLSRITKSDQHLSALEKTISRRMTRGVEKICSSADKQIGDELQRLPRRATGLLILINESLTDLHPRDVADRVVAFASARPTNIHYCLLIFESHKARINNELLPYPLLVDLTYSARQRCMRESILNIRSNWAKENGFPHGLPSPEPTVLEYHPGSITFGH
jgi:hypothetical protein